MRFSTLSIVPAAKVTLTVQNTSQGPLTVQFDHRMMGYFVLLMILAFAWTARSSRLVQPTVRAGAYLLALVAILQVALGVITLLLVDPLWMGMIHQLVAVLLLTCAVWVTWRARRV